LRRYEFVLIAVLLTGCAGSRGSTISRALERTPHDGPPQAILRVPAVVQRGSRFHVELALVGSPRREVLQRPVAVVLAILDGGHSIQTVTWGEPRVGRYFKWTVPAIITREIESDHIVVRVALHHLASYTYSGEPILTKPFLLAAKVVRVRHPVAHRGEILGLHQAEVHD